MDEGKEPVADATLDMVERVARALFKLENSFPGACSWDEECGAQAGRVMREYWFGSARAAIEAMREPTEAMLDAFLVNCHREEVQIANGITIDGGLRVSPEERRNTYRRMIDAALQASEAGGSPK